MNLTHYDVDSLVYLSTDIVVARMSVDAQRNISATVTEVLYGSLHPGDRVEPLAPFLAFFRPMEDKMNAVLFLDSRSHTYDFLHSDAARARFAVPPSGVYLIDDYGHVHEYFQQDNPGPYVAVGYSFFMQKVAPTQEQDLKLSSLAETEKSIANSVASVNGMRALLDKDATRDDLPRLFALLQARIAGGAGCGFGAGDAISERLMKQIRSFNDPDLLLKLGTLGTNVTSAYGFVQPEGSRDRAFTASRVAYLLRVLSDKKADPPLRVAAAETLLNVAAMRSGAQSGPAKTWQIDNEWLAGSAATIRATARTVFDNGRESVPLRSLCLQFLPLDDPKTLRDVKRVYAGAHSNELRFAVEVAILKVSDSLYESLHAPGGPTTSIVAMAPPSSCVKAAPGNTAFIMRYRQRRDFREAAMFAGWRYALTSIKTGLRAPVDVHVLGGWSSTDDGEGWFELGKASGLPPGVYRLSLERLAPVTRVVVGRDDDRKVLSAGYPLTIVVKDTPSGRVITTQPVH